MTGIPAEDPSSLPPDGAGEAVGPPAPPSRRRTSRIALAFLALAAVAIVAGGFVASSGQDERDAAARKEAAASRALIRAQSALERAETDLTAARATIATFGASAGGAVAAGANLLELETTLVDRLTRLRAAGAAQDIDTYNRVVDDLNRASDALVAGFAALEAPLEAFTTALQRLPTARCTGPVATSITWTPYGGNGLQCARLQVPLDYSAPDGEQIDITVVRRPADDAAASLGPLAINPGGPGASGVAFMRDAVLLLPPEILRRFDLIAFDPRGVGLSSPVDCADNLDPLFNPDLTAPEQSVRTKSLAAIKRIVRGCGQRSGSLLANVDTISAARDMDRMRAALGVEQLSYLGFSYGTYLGAVYADLFPTRVRAAVLDGAVNPHPPQQASAVGSSAAFNAALESAFGRCAADPGCAFFSGGDPSNAFDELMKRIAKQPLNVDGRLIGRSQAELAVIGGLYQGEDGWPRLMTALARAGLGDGAPLSGLSDEYTGRRADGSSSNMFEALYAINCIDPGARLDRDDAVDRVRDLPVEPARFAAAALASSLPCAFWPAAANDTRPGTLDAAGAPSILVIGGEHDPATPIEGAKALAGELKSGVLLRWAGTGHTAFGRGSECIDDAVVTYLVDLVPPARGTTCPAD